MSAANYELIDFEASAIHELRKSDQYVDEAIVSMLHQHSTIEAYWENLSDEEEVEWLGEHCKYERDKTASFSWFAYLVFDHMITLNLGVHLNPAT